jgi:hypothetical protein
MDDAIGWMGFCVSGSCRPWSGYTVQVGVICPYVICPYANMPICQYVIVIELHKRHVIVFLSIFPYVWTKSGLLTLFTYTAYADWSFCYSDTSQINTALKMSVAVGSVLRLESWVRRKEGRRKFWIDARLVDAVSGAVHCEAI